MSEGHPVTDAPAVRSVASIRSDFPALQRRHEGRPVAYFDGPGGTQVPRPVVEAMTGYLTGHNANTHWAYPTSIETDAILDEARRTLARFLNATPDEVAFGPNMTSLTFHLSRTIGRRLGPGDAIVVTELDHHANVDPWRALAVERGVTLRHVPLRPETGTLDWEALERAIRPDVKLVAVGAASNALGTINDVAAAARLAHDAGAWIFVDAVHFAPHVLVDVRTLGCDFLACSPYKFYGPHAGVLFGRREVLAALDVPKLEPAPDGPAERFETGTQSHEAIAGAAAAVRYLESIAPDTDPSSPGTASRTPNARALEGRAALEATYAALHARARALFARLWEGLTGIDGVTVYGPPPSAPRTPTVAFTVAGRSSEEVARALARQALFLSHGDFYALTVVRRLGLEGNGLVRAGCACYTTDEEVERLLAGVAGMAATPV
jgi:cysteine desulfurase family protein (TIGR01976 family)